MNLDYREHLPESFDDNSRVWIYQSNRLLTISEAFEVESILNDFLQQWNAHGSAVKGYANLLFGQFIVLMADETQTTVSGCSTDSSVRMIKEIEHKLGIQLFNRQLFAFVVKDKLQLLPMNQLQYALDNNYISGDTLYFNNLVSTKKELLNNWIIPIRESWLSKKFALA